MLAFRGGEIHKRVHAFPVAHSIIKFDLLLSMNTLPAEEEIFDDLHSGVVALQNLARTESMSLTPRAAETLQRLRTTVPGMRERLRRWKQVLKDNATCAVDKTDEIVRDYPWFCTLGALALGVLTGLVLAGSGKDERD